MLEQSLWKNSDGNLLAVTAALMPLIVASGAISVDAMNWVLQKRELQAVSDAAAVAGAAAKQQGKDVSEAVREIIEDEYPHISLNVAATVENGPATGTYAGNSTAVRVSLQRKGNVAFLSMFRSDPILINAYATAALMPNPKYCMLSLENSSTAGIEFEGSTDLDLDCGMATNSTGNPAMTIGGTSARIKTTELSAVGHLNPSSQFSTNSGSPVKYFPGQPQQPDPYASVPIPPLGSCRAAETVAGSGTAQLTPGCWTGGLNFNGSANLAPGTYIINGGELRFGGNGNITGTGVTFVLTGPTSTTVAKLVIEGGARLTLAAPTSGTYKGLVFYQNRIAASLINGLVANNVVQGNSNLSIDGAFYFPSQQLTFTGGGSLRSSCTRVISKRIKFTGQSSAFSGGCSLTDNKLEGQRVRLVA